MTRKRQLAGAATLLGSGLAALLLSDLPARWLVAEDPFDVVDAAAVMAGDPDYERTSAAAALVRSGRARLLFLTGGDPGPGDSASSLRDRAMALGVDPSLIRAEEVSHSTRESLLALRPMLQRDGVRTVALVTSPYHQRRATLAARRAWPGVQVWSHPAQPSSFSPQGWWRKARSRRVLVFEYLKLAYYAFRGWL